MGRLLSSVLMMESPLHDTNGYVPERLFIRRNRNAFIHRQICGVSFPFRPGDPCTHPILHSRVPPDLSLVSSALPYST